MIPEQKQQVSFLTEKYDFMNRFISSFLYAQASFFKLQLLASSKMIYF